MIQKENIHILGSLHSFLTMSNQNYPELSALRVAHAQAKASEASEDVAS